VGVPHSAVWPWGLASTVGRRPGRGARMRRDSISGRGVPGVADVRAPASSARGREESGTGGAWAGLEEKGLGRARRNRDVWNLFKSISN
jgi:hypothetical protein